MSVLVLSVWSVASCVVVKFGSVALVQGIVSPLAATSSTLSLHALFRGLGYTACLVFLSQIVEMLVMICNTEHTARVTTKCSDMIAWKSTFPLT